MLAVVSCLDGLVARESERRRTGCFESRTCVTVGDKGGTSSPTGVVASPEPHEGHVQISP